MNPLHHFSTFLVFIAIVCVSCSRSDSKEDKQRYEQSEYIYRIQSDKFSAVPPQIAQAPDPYPWERSLVGNCMKITKDFFRCRGSNLNPVHTAQEKGELVRYYDCGGADKHSLPVRDQKEFVFPILIDLLNYIQVKTHQRVVITSGHRCPDHNIYVDPSEGNRYSKHMIAAEVSFYVQGFEERPEAIVKVLQAYFADTSKYKGKKEYLEFQRYDKGDTDVSTLPWYNKEVFVKLYRKKEGRNFDNRHPYSYLSIQVRYDYDKQEKVIYTWDKANNNYMRY